jgi:hypothetical protein
MKNDVEALAAEIYARISGTIEGPQVDYAHFKELAETSFRLAEVFYDVKDRRPKAPA